ncbi:hypothetical protein C8R47DRAFT_1099591 [Mycena vitilis]|nr:hypothetical protein C8R47DRAFT_1099591 [Mycena vitilis]
MRGDGGRRETGARHAPWGVLLLCTVSKACSTWTWTKDGRASLNIPFSLVCFQNKRNGDRFIEGRIESRRKNLFTITKRIITRPRIERDLLLSASFASEA